MAKIQIKSERLTPFGGLFSIMEQFDTTGIIHNFYKAIIQRLDVKKFGLNATSRIKAFVFRFISVPAKWIRTSRGMCWISIPVIMLTQMFSRLILDNAYNLWE